MKGTITVVASMPGVTLSQKVSREASGGVAPQEHVLAAGEAGTLSTRTNDTDGTLTLGADHGILEGDVISIFWVDANGVNQFAYDATVGVVVTTSVPFTGAAGTVLPAQATAIVADEEEELDVDFDGDKLQMLAAGGNRVCGFQFVESDDSVIDAVVRAAGEPYQFVKDIDATNPLAGDPVDAVRVANGDSANTCTFKLGGVYDSDT